jgi:LuxR family transcriptional regulator, activator of conjugal transfer of Ti plasmids
LALAAAGNVEAGERSLAFAVLKPAESDSRQAEGTGTRQRRVFIWSYNMKSVERSFQEFIDAIQTAEDEIGFALIAKRITERLGFRWFAYLRLSGDVPALMSSYPKSWTDRYLDLGYQQIDPVVRRARQEIELFNWCGSAAKAAGTREQRRFFDEAMTFGIKSGVTVPIRSGFGRMAAFTMATDEPTASVERLMRDSKDVCQLVGLYFHAHVVAKVRTEVSRLEGEGVLTQRERQCLAWAARGKTVADSAILIGIAPRTVVFHLERAREKLNASSIAQCVAEAMRRRLLP